MSRRFKVLQEFEHYPTEFADEKHPYPVVAKAGSTVDDIRPDSIQGLIDTGVIEEVLSKKSEGGEG